MFKKIYYSEFKDLNENIINIEIYKDIETDINAKELLLSSDSVQINYEGSDDIFKPIKCSDAQINALTDTVLTDLYTAKNDVYCVIKRNGSIMWYGYSTACLYQSDYVDTDNLSLQFNDIISTLETVQYSYFNNNAPVSFYQLIKNMIKRVDKANLIENIYLHKSLKLNNIDDLLNNFYIVERNFFDEEEEPENCKNILEYVAKYLNSTISYFDNSIYIIDYSAIDSIKNFILYNLTDDTTSDVTLSDDINDINSNIYQTNATISINDNYNNLVIIANTNSSNSTLPDMFEGLINENSDPNKYYETAATVDNVDYTILNAFFKPNENYETNRPYNIITLEEVKEITPDTAGYGGSYFQRAAYYETAEEPSSLSWDTYLTSVKSLTKDLIIKTKTDKFFCGKDGYFIIDLKYRFTEDWNAAECLKTSDEVYTKNKYTTGYTDTMFIAKLHVGDKYFDGDSWVDNSVYENKVNNGYYRNDLQGPAQVEGAKWYKYKDSHGWWVYCTKEDYDSATTQKLSGDCVTNFMYYFTENGTKIFVEENYYRECQLQDGFYLVHKNNEGDKIFDTEYQLTNTVSWRYNLAESEDGVAIKLPKQIIYGNLYFELDNPTVLGKYPNYRTDIECHKANCVHISEFKLKYTTSDSVVDIFDLETYESDIKFENVIDDDIVKSLDDIEMRINTFNSNAVSYSYVLNNTNGKFDYVDTLYNVKNNENLKSEEHYIKKYVEYYSSMKYTYSNNIYDKDIKPYTIFYENTLDKKFALNSITYNLAADAAEITVKEI